MKTFLFYVGRWQLSTPILWLVVSRLGTGLEATIIANLVGASIFFWVDRFIFRANTPVIWEFLVSGSCCDCGMIARVRRLVLAPGGKTSPAGVYDRRSDTQPAYRCPDCSASKLSSLRLANKITSKQLAGPGLR
jgi:hypothetical protein